MFKKRRIIAYLLILLMVFNLSNYGGWNIRAEGQDITEHVNISAEVLTPAENIKVGNEIRFKYKWSVPFEKMSHVTEGSYFKIQLPANTLISYRELSGDIVNNNPGGGDAFGTYSLSDTGLVRVQFNDNGASQSELKNGIFEFTGTANKVGTINHQVENGSETLNFTIKAADNGNDGSGSGSGGGGNDGGQAEITPDQLINKKTGVQGKNLEATKLIWNIRVNYEEMNKAFNGTSASVKNNVILIDELPQTMEIEPAHSGYKYIITASTTLYAPTPEGRMSGHGFDAQVPIEFIEGDFDNVEAIKEKLKTVSKPTAIVWNNGIYIGLGSLPGGMTYKELYGSEQELYNKIDGFDLEAAQKSAMKQKYSAGGALEYIHAYDITIRAQPKKNEYGNFEDGKHDNTALLEWGSESSTLEEKNVVFSWVKAYAESGTKPTGGIKILKYEGEEADPTINPIKDVEFQISKKGGDLISTTPFKTDDKGEIVVRNLDLGEYKIKEISAPQGYIVDERLILVNLIEAQPTVEKKVYNKKVTTPPTTPETPPSTPPATPETPPATPPTEETPPPIPDIVGLTSSGSSSQERETDVLPGMIPSLSSGSTSGDPSTAVDPGFIPNRPLPKTGDGFGYEFYSILLGIAGLGLTSTGYVVGRKKYRK